MIKVPSRPIGAKSIQKYSHLYGCNEYYKIFQVATRKIVNSYFQGPLISWKRTIWPYLTQLVNKGDVFLFRVQRRPCFYLYIFNGKWPVYFPSWFFKKLPKITKARILNKLGCAGAQSRLRQLDCKDNLSQAWLISILEVHLKLTKFWSNKPF